MKYITFSTPLSPLEQHMLDLVQHVPLGTDCNIDEIHASLYTRAHDRDAKQRQQYVGSVIQRVNKKMIGYKIIPGQMKRTYRLVANLI